MAEVVTGAFLSSMFQFLFERMDSPEILAFFMGRKLNRALVRKLKITMIIVNGLIDQAEEKQIVMRSEKKWLDELKDAAYEADDLFDEIAYEALRSKLNAGSVARKVSKLFSSHNSFENAMNAKLEEILELLECLLRQMNALGLNLKDDLGDEPSSHKTPTTSVIPYGHFGIYGREHDRQNIIRSLLSNDSNGVSAICIVGISGVGKTSLAQHVYYDKQVDRHFDLKAWVYVSEEFNVFKITTDIYNQVSSEDIYMVKGSKELQLELKQKLEGKKFLLVLDDVWSDELTEWESLLEPLEAGRQGSKIVVTTHKESVASAMQHYHMHIDIHNLEKLSDDNCRHLLETYAFHNQVSHSSHSVFEDVGKKIAENCRGLPLVLKTVGSLLRSKRNVQEWEEILKNMLPSDNILSTLKLSYYSLPSHLKQCFAYCGIFPKAYEFYKEDLVRLWMAEGFIIEAKDGNDNEVVGDAYFNDLVSRSFFQMSGGSQKCFVMHDHIYDLAKSISGEFCFMMEGKDSSVEVPSKTRYLYVRHGDSCHSHGYYKFIIAKVNKSQVLRTFFSDKYFHGSYRVMHALLPKFKHLRVLFLYDYRKKKLPNSIGNLKHLRYLNFRGASIRKLPHSMSSLYNLQTLILRDCRYLVKLPTNMKRLINLCCLDLRGTRLRRMPPHMGNLKKLRTLTNFSLGKESGSGIEELGKLQHIRGDLSIENLQNANPKHVGEANLRAKEHLKTLEFQWSGKSKDSERARSVLEELRPHEKVENLRIFGYEGVKFPEWVGFFPSSLSNLVCLKLSDCYNCSTLPPLGQLTSLKELSIIGFTKLMFVGSEFYGSCGPAMKPFRSLEILRFERMKQWEEWKDGDGAFPKLEELYVKECPKLTKAFPSHLPCLKKLQVVGCKKQLVLSLRVPHAIPEVMLMDNSSEVELKKLPSGMHCLKLYESDLVNSLFKWNGLLSALEEIQLYGCDMEYFPLEFLPNLQRLEICECSYLKSLGASQQIEGESSSCRNLVSFGKGESPAPKLTKLFLEDCVNLKSLPECIGSHPSLVKLEIRSCRELVLFPKGSLPSKLESLIIEDCLELKIKVIAGVGSNYEGDEETVLLPSTLTCLKSKDFEIWNLSTTRGF